MIQRILIALSLVALGGCFFDLGSFTRTQPLESKVVMGDSGPKLAMVELNGVISEAERGSPFGITKPSMVARALEALDRASDDGVAGLLVKINSPGGSVSASETLHHEVLRWKEETGKPVVAYFQGMATSGGYYVAMASDEIVAHPVAITGSIGVILPGVNVSGLLNRFGVVDQSFTSGPYKDAGSPIREMRPEERKYLQAVVADLYDRFKEVVLLGRPELSKEQIAPLADGRIFTSRQALENGLVDRMGHLEDAVAALEKRAGIPESRLVVYHPPGQFRDNVYTQPGRPPVNIIDVDILSLDTKRLEPGFYYLWPPAVSMP